MSKSKEIEVDNLHKVLKTANVDDYEEIMDVFKQHKETFPHIRGDKVMRQIVSKNIVWENGVLITWNRYKRIQKLGFNSFTGVGSSQKALYKVDKNIAHRGACILHQIAARDQGNGSAKKVFEKFIGGGNFECDVFLSVRSENKRARGFYEKYGFKLVGDIEWGKTKQVKGKVYLLEQRPYFEGYKGYEK